MVEGSCVGVICKPPEFEQSNGRKILKFVLKHAIQFKGELKPSILCVSYYGDPSRFFKRLEVGDLVSVSGQITARKNDKNAFLTMMARSVDNSMGLLKEGFEPSPPQNTSYQNPSYQQGQYSNHPVKTPSKRQSDFNGDDLYDF